MDKNEMDKRMEPPENKIIYAPFEEIRNIEQVIYDLEMTRRELQRMAEGMKPIKN